MIATDLKRLEAYPLEQISKLYSNKLKYHNFNHALKVTHSALMLVDRCKRYNIVVREQVVIWATLLHDAGYQFNHTSRGFATKEDYSAYIAKSFLKEQNVPEIIADEVIACIISTHSRAPFVTVEQKIVRAADLWGLAENYKEFKKNTLLLKMEYEFLTKQTISMSEWIKLTKNNLRSYLFEKIVLTPEYANKEGKSHFHQGAKANLLSLTKEYS